MPEHIFGDRKIDLKEAAARAANFSPQYPARAHIKALYDSLTEYINLWGVERVREVVELAIENEDEETQQRVRGGLRARTDNMEHAIKLYNEAVPSVKETSTDEELESVIVKLKEARDLYRHALADIGILQLPAGQ